MWTSFFLSLLIRQRRRRTVSNTPQQSGVVTLRWQRGQRRVVIRPSLPLA